MTTAPRSCIFFFPSPSRLIQDFLRHRFRFFTIISPCQSLLVNIYWWWPLPLPYIHHTISQKSSSSQHPCPPHGHPRQWDTGLPFTLGEDFFSPHLLALVRFGLVWCGSVRFGYPCMIRHSQEDRALLTLVLVIVGATGSGVMVLLCHDLTTNIPYYNLFGVSVSLCHVMFFRCFVFRVYLFCLSCPCSISCSFIF